MMEPSVLIPVAPGTNRDGELALAFEAAGARASVVPLEALRRGDTKLVDHQILAIPGGFSYGDALGAGRLLGLDLATWFAEELFAARERDLPMIGICNGFQALVRTGLLPGSNGSGATASTGSRPSGGADDARSAIEAPSATLAENANGRFECRWVDLIVDSADSPWLDGVDDVLRCPVAHGEGRFVADDLAAVEANHLVAFRYAKPDGEPAGGVYPTNPNGSAGDVAGVVDPTGLVIGLMPHPEDHVFAHQDPARHRGAGGSCLPLFEAGVRAVAGG